MVIRLSSNLRKEVGSDCLNPKEGERGTRVKVGSWQGGLLVTRKNFSGKTE
jgi:hypothetical protein